jgi:hypothetical protein
VKKKYVLDIRFTTEVEAEDPAEAFVKATSGLRYDFPTARDLSIITVNEILPAQVPVAAEKEQA